MDFRRMRRFKQELGRKDCLEIIKRGTSGVLSLLGDGGYPYGVPIGYVFIPGDGAPENADGPAEGEGSGGCALIGDSFYFHAAKVGHKIDAIRSCDKASFAIIDRDDVVSDEFTTYFKSLIAFGKIHLVEDEEEKAESIDKLARRYSPDETDESVKKAIEKEYGILQMIRFDVEHMTGKEAVELMRNNEKYGKRP